MMQCFQKICVQKFRLLQSLPMIKQPSCNLFTRVTSQSGPSRWTIAYKVTYNRSRAIIPIAIKPLLVRYCSRDIGSEITKPVLLYRGDEKRLFQFVSLFAFSQLIFWGYLTHVAFTSMTDTHMRQEIRYGAEGAPKELRNWTTWAGLKLKLSASRWRYGITILSMVTGAMIFVLAFLYSRKNINALVLRQGGKHLTFKTYGIFAQGYTFTVPVSHVSCEYTRHGGRKTLPIKVKDRRMFYTLDTGDGKFYNGRLFDTIVTVKRHL